MPKKLLYLSLISISALMLLGAASVFAVGNYVPLVNIPGAGIPSNLTAYLLGFYNFLLSIVGIIAMVAIVWGGFRYMTSAGNATAMAEAKDIILNAVLGLILALLSYLILTTINPDLLMISKPVSNLANINVPGINRPIFSSCCAGAGCNPDETTGMCTCVDGAKVLPCTTDPDCGPGATCGADAPPKCIQGCTPADPDCTPLTNPTCAGAGDGCLTGCNGACRDSSAYHCLVADALIGDNLNSINSDKITVKVGEKVYLDLSHSKDYSGQWNIARYEICWIGTPGFGFCPALDGSQCCDNIPPLCIGWPILCNLIGGMQVCADINKPPYTFEHIYNTPGKYYIWIGVHDNGPTFGGCYSTEKEKAITVDVIP